MPFLWRNRCVMGFKLCLMCPLGHSEYALLEHTLMQRNSALWMIGHARHTFASVMLVCETEVEGDVKVRFMFKCCQVCRRSHLVPWPPSALMCRRADAEGGICSVWEIWGRLANREKILSFYLFRFTMVFMTKCAVHNWSIILVSCCLTH